MVKQHHISYEKATDMYWLVLPDDTEKHVIPYQIANIDFNKIYIEMYKLYLSNRKEYDRLKVLEVDDMIAELLV